MNLLPLLVRLLRAGARQPARSRGRRTSAPALPSLLRKPVWMLVLMLAGGGLYYGVEVQVRERHAYAGLPQASDWRNWQTWHRVLRNDGFMVGYSDFHLNPLWVTYRLEPLPPAATGPRPGRFADDWRTPPFWRARHEDYSGSGYDRGHLAPNYAIARVHGREAQLQTFLMTNISPQTPALNRQVWQRIEQAAMDHFVQIQQEVWVIAGPVFGPDSRRLKSGVAIPEAFYKIFIAPPRDQRPLQTLAFMVPQTVRGNEALDRFVVSIRDIEQRTGLDFLHRLPAQAQAQLETRIQPEPWRLNDVSRRPGRFE